MAQVSHELKNLKHSNDGSNPTSLAASLADMSKKMSNFRLNKRPEIPPTQKTKASSKNKIKQAKNGENCNPSSTVDKKSKKNKIKTNGSINKQVAPFSTVNTQNLINSDKRGDGSIKVTAYNVQDYMRSSPAKAVKKKKTDSKLLNSDDLGTNLKFI